MWPQLGYCAEKARDMNGYGNNIWGPSNTLSRGMLAQIIYNRESRPSVTGDSPFADVADGAWYAEAVTWAAAHGVVVGYGNGRFGPNDPITREQLAVMLYRYEQRSGGGFTGDWMFQLDYSDAANVSDWAYEAMCWRSMNGIVEGKGTGILDPKGNATRAEAAAMLLRYFEPDR